MAAANVLILTPISLFEKKENAFPMVFSKKTLLPVASEPSGELL